eukprot:266048-Amphidinium_carterae.1
MCGLWQGEWMCARSMRPVVDRRWCPRRALCGRLGVTVDGVLLSRLVCLGSPVTGVTDTSSAEPACTGYLFQAPPGVTGEDVAEQPAMAYLLPPSPASSGLKVLFLPGKVFFGVCGMSWLCLGLDLKRAKQFSH